MTTLSSAPFDSLQMMSYIIERCRRLGITGICATKLEKLMYCCYGVCLAARDFRLCDESPEAWQYGPVFPRTLRRFKEMGVDSFADMFPYRNVEENLPDTCKSAIDQTLLYFGKYSATQLSTWSHNKGSPWSKASNNGKNLYEQIDDTTIRTFFRERVIRSV